MSKERVGAYGERIAAEYLRSKGYSIIATNWHCTRGELDIVARDGDTLVFVEVKTLRSPSPDNAFLNVTVHKRQRLIASAYMYIANQKLDNPAWRIDVIGIALPQSGQPVIEHVEDALDW
jgi:putative endonuclease